MNNGINLKIVVFLGFLFESGENMSTLEMLVVANIVLVVVVIILLFVMLVRKSKVVVTSGSDLKKDEKIHDIYYGLKQISDNLETKTQSLTYTINTSSEKQIDRNRQFEVKLVKDFNENANKIVEIVRNNTENNLKRSSEFERELSKVFADNTRKLSYSIQDEFKKLNDTVEKHLNQLNNRVEERLEKSFAETNKTFNNIIERLTKIDEAQRKIEELSTDIVSLQNVLTDKKTRGTFGEVQLSHILASVFGEKADGIYKLQHKLSNNTIADAVVFVPEPIGTIAIDSKFPLENYQRMVDRELSEVERQVATKKFKEDIKKHIQDISSKYIIQNETTNQAIMFIPAEAIFAEINAYHVDLVEYSNKKKVWLVSPTTFMSTLTTIQVILRDLERNIHSKILHEELQKLGIEFGRYQDRWEKLSRNIKTVYNTANELDTTATKINTRFSSIAKVDIKALESESEIARHQLEINE